MFKPIPMLKANIIILSQYQTQVSIKLGEFGLIHLMDATEQSHGILKDLNRTHELFSSDGLLHRVESLMEHLGIEVKEVTLPVIYKQEQLVTEVTGIENQVDELKKQANRLVQEAESLKGRQKDLTGFPLQKVPLREISNLSYLYAVSGEVDNNDVAVLQNQFGDRCILLNVSSSNPQKQNILILTTKKDRWELEDALQKIHFVQKKIDLDTDHTASDEIHSAEQRLAEIQDELENIQQQVSILAIKNGDLLCGFLTQVKKEKLLFQAEQYFGVTQNLCCICGWIPVKRAEELTKLVKEMTDDTGVIQFTKPEEDPLVKAGKEQVPVLFSGGKFSKPFEFLIKVYGTPRYNEVEPTLFFAFSFILMFSVMFGDAGQGLFILLMGQILAHLKNQKVTDEVRGVGWLLTFCGAGSMVMGLVVGSFFGFEPHQYPRLINPQKDVMALFAIALSIGIVCLSLSMIINVINKFKNRRYFDALLDKAGVAGIIFYWGAIGFGSYAAIQGKIRGWQVALILLPVLFIIAREPLQNLIQRKKTLVENGWGLFIMESALESFEIVNGFFSNTLSFIRVGAFAISHAVMCSLIYILLDSIRSSDWAGSVAKVFIIIVGNLLIIVVEGMVVSIQSMRLQLYELFSKYFVGDGLEYKPFSLKK